MAKVREHEPQLIAVGFTESGHPWTILVSDGEYEDGRLSCDGYDIDRRRVGRGYVRRWCMTASFRPDNLRFADRPKSHWARKGLEVRDAGKRVQRLPRNCHGLLDRFPEAFDLLEGDGPDETDADW